MSAGVAVEVDHPRGARENELYRRGAEIPNGYGLGGGLPGATVRYLRFDGAGTIADLAAVGLPADVADIPGRVSARAINSSHSAFAEDAVEYHNWQGGGGYGDPLDRPPDAVRWDVANGAVSPEVAASVYGVVLADGEVDAPATAQARDEALVRRRARSTIGSATLVAGVVAASGGNAERRAPDHPEVLRYGDLLEFDLKADTVRCSRCGTGLGSAFADFKLACLVEEGPVAGDVGPVRGEMYDGPAVLRRFHCPGCARMLEAEVSVPGAPRASFVLSRTR
jgi:N-methylhydantoinase B